MHSKVAHYGGFEHRLSKNEAASKLRAHWTPLKIVILDFNPGFRFVLHLKGKIAFSTIKDIIKTLNKQKKDFQAPKIGDNIIWKVKTLGSIIPIFKQVPNCMKQSIIIFCRLHFSIPFVSPNELDIIINERKIELRVMWLLYP